MGTAATVSRVESWLALGVSWLLIDGWWGASLGWTWQRVGTIPGSSVFFLGGRGRRDIGQFCVHPFVVKGSREGLRLLSCPGQIWQCPICYGAKSTAWNNAKLMLTIALFR